MKNRLLDSREFFRLLQGRSARNAERIDRVLRDRAERDVTIFMSDSSGLTPLAYNFSPAAAGIRPTGQPGMAGC